MADRQFDGRVALVTGAGSGIGYEEATSLARLGAKVVVNDVRTKHGERPEEATAEEVAAELTAEGLTAVADTGSIGDEDYAVGLVERTVERFGRIDILINNAGIIARGTSHDTDTKFLMDTFAINFLGSFWTQRAALGYMREQNYGRILNTSSGAAAFGAPGFFPYIVSKTAIVGLSRSAALDNADFDVKINSLCPVARTMMDPDHFDSRAHVDKDMVHPKWVTPIAMYLVGEECKFSGETLSAGVGVWARVFTGKTRGVPPNGLSSADVAEVIDDIFDVSEFKVLRSAAAQYDD
ncbi:SDR family NAD(P)-dependent oxidoreductase [Rhodococcus wratislaviensis]|uniref:Putative oxidoreductase n=1 Tax=Rhodococcus wratislaviensis NBRC 100605 TaxID=1219028 RepID=X0Q7T5_RHOWR|nr:SDR family NAD(P)-dependent oxidoreductase [Rhodococcus wratislaviensis]GAF47482.1 putative oxidoreductase [Rhodococcus wratislaviensis NBRC 100605]